MKVAIVLLLGVIAYYTLQIVSMSRISQRMIACSQTQQISLRMNQAKSDAEKQVVLQDVFECVDEKNSFIDSFFFDVKSFAK